MKFVTLAVVSAVAVASAKSYPACPDDLECITVTNPSRPNFTFNCSVTAPPASAPEMGSIYFMHGNDGKNSKAMWADTMTQAAALGYSCLACDQRGYSVGASPDTYDSYNYNELVEDIFSIVNTTFGTGKFHLVSHDQGARVSWHGIAKGELRSRLLSFTSLSIPHSDVFSDALYGNATVSDQQTNSQYVRVLTLPNSTTVYNNAVLDVVCSSLDFTTAEACQKVLWWYNGAIDSGAMALAPFLPYGPIGQMIGVPQNVTSNLTQYNLSGVPQTVKVGQVSEFPVLYACGAKDTADLCLSQFEEQSKALISNFSYLQLTDCGHDVISSACSQQQQMIDMILSHVQNATTTASSR